MIWNFCIRRPVFTLVIFLVLTVFGMWGYYSMPVRENPDIDFPIVSVNVVYPGAEPEVIETEVLEPLEEEINTIEGLKTLTSTAREQVGTVTAEFELWRDVDIAAQDVRDRVQRARRQLPTGIEEPIVMKLDPDARSIMWITLIGDDRWDSVRLSTYADEVLKPRLENLRGVGRIQIGGERRYAARVKLDPEQLAAHQVTVADVVSTIRRNNVNIPSGRIESQSREFLIRTQGQFDSPEPINDLIVAYRDDGSVRISDVGYATDGVENDRRIARFAGERAVGLGVVKQSDANTVALATALRERIAELDEDFPPGLVYTIAMDSSEFIEESITDLLVTIGLASSLVVLVVLGFLRTGWGTVIVGLAIPSSLLAAAAGMYVLGFSVNTLTMLALILAIGIVVDDAIVVLESCYRHMEGGTESIPAARAGTTEVAFPAVANTMALAAVFIPVAFTYGLIGRFFFEFGLTVTATVFASTFTALTLTPTLCSRLLRVPERHGRLFRWSEWAFRLIERIYAAILGLAFRARIVTVLLGVAAFALGGYLFSQLSTEFSPNEDRESLMIRFETPEGATIRKTDAYAAELERVLAEEPTVEHQFMAIGLSRGGGPGRVNEGIMFVHLTPRETRDQHQSEIMQKLRAKFAMLPGGRAFVLETSAVAGMGGAPVEFVLRHPDIRRLAEGQQMVMDWMRKQPEFVGINSNLKMNKPQVNVSIKREKASQMAISVEDISNTMRFLLGEPDISEIQVGTERYDIIPEVIGKGEMVPRTLRQLYVRGAGDELVSLDNLVDIREVIGPSEIHHHGRIRAATLSASNPPDVPLGDAMNKLTAYLDEDLPGEFDYTFTGTTQDLQESFVNLTIAMIFSVVFIYLVLAAQFESWLHPFTILLSLPLALVGAAGGLWLMDLPFGIVAFVGLIMLLGMATKNAILLVDYTNVLIARGHELFDAAKQAARVRFRPVLMTAVSTVCGLLPVAVGFGAGGEARVPLGVAVVAGMTATTALTLLIIPVVYTLFAQIQYGLGRLFSRRAPARDKETTA
ncbi:MAG: efflux RND transporter permease subunit [Planctomycetota bacterium]